MCLKNKPNLFLVGWPKTGSTSLYYYLSQHPEIYMSPVKPVYYHATDLINESYLVGGESSFKIKTEEEYLKLFDGVENEVVIGEFSALYIISNEALPNIKKFNPLAKIIVIIRDPVELVASWHHYLKHRNRENTASVVEAIKLQEIRKKLKKMPPIVNTPIHLQYDEIADIDKHYKKLLSTFAEENIFVIFYEDLKNNEKNILRNLFEFLKIDADFSPDLTHQNVSVQLKNTKLKALIDSRKSKVVELLSKWGLLKSNKGLHKLYLNIFTKNKKRQPLSDKQMEFLNNRYKNQINFYNQIKEKRKYS